MSRLLGLLISVCVVAVYGRTVVVLDPTYTLTYQLVDNNTAIEFSATANTTGWVGFGINHVANMTGADIVMGGLYIGVGGYFKDYHGNTSVNTRPIEDPQQDWNFLDRNSSETATQTTLSFKRLLNTTDLLHDIEIKNETVFVLWSYGPSDDVTRIHVQRGWSPLNLFQ